MQTAISTSKQTSNTSETLNYAIIAAEILRDLAQASHIPYVRDAAEGSLLLLNEINGMKINQGMLSRIVELTHRLLCVVVHTCLEEQGVLPIKVLDYVAHFVATLRRITTSVQLQQELGKFKRFIRQHEIGVQLRTYEVELHTILDNFKIHDGVSLAAILAEFELDAEQRHQELLALLAAQDGKSSEYSGSFRGSNSSSIFSVFPPCPKIFHGRDSELMQIAATLKTGPAHLAILGPGGMGKTTLAIAALHHPEILSEYDQRHFISCGSAFDNSQLLNIISTHLRLEPSKHLLRDVINHFVDCGSTLLVLDNFETAWEQADGRAEVEETLSLLSEVSQLSLLITMRATARRTFIEIADSPPSEEEEDLEELLNLSGNLPLAISLMAAVASYEGYSKTLIRWKIENTALLSNGYDKKSNLETSIMISLSSPRMLSSPGAKELLSLLSLLPDGLSEDDLLSRDAVDKPNILQCRATLIRVSLAYIENGRLKALSPIRQYMKRAQPPPFEAVERLRRHWDSLLAIWKSHQESKELVPRLTLNLRNIDSVTQVALSRKLSGAEHQRLMLSILSLDLFLQKVLVYNGNSTLAQQALENIQSIGDQRLHWDHICSCLDVDDYYNLASAQADVLIRQGVQYYEQEQNPTVRLEFYKAAARYHYLAGNLPKALQFNRLGTTPAEKQNYREQLNALNLAVDLRRTSITNSVAGQRLAEKQAAMHWTVARLRYTSDLCKLGRDILVTYGYERSSREINVLDIEAGIKFERSEYDEACALYEGVVRMTDHDRHPYFHANALLNLVKIDQTIGGDEADVLRGLATASRASERLNWRQGMLFCERLMAGVHLARGDIMAARKGYTICFESCRRLYMLPGLTQCLEMFGDLKHGMCDLEATFHWAGTYLAVVRVYRDVVRTYQALRCLGDIFLAQGDTETALSVFYAVLEGVTEMDIHRTRADCMSRIGDILMAQGNKAEARRMWEDARPLFVRSSQMKDAASIDARLAQFAES
ncbi:hypothetical protein B0H19DRAFT_1256041 [Mycena capillaripes]|nr:hypothetical protein B0H19DRAFT_1256041 [Mycena capillaripes]